jgi:cell division septation protein DedD
MVLASFGGASIVFVALAMMRAPSEAKLEPTDPLGDLVARSHPAGAPRPAHRLGSDDISFPAVLSDQKDPTTAMEVVRSARDRERERERRRRGGTAAPEPPQPPPPSRVETRPPTDPLRTEPLPAGDVLNDDRGRPAKNDKLRLRADSLNAKHEHGGTMVDAGRSGGYQLQVSSFKNLTDAESFAQALRRRGHRSYIETAHVKGRGVWHRVRIGPFRYKRSAMIYRQNFEAKERLVTFVVDPPKTRVRIGLAED